MIGARLGSWILDRELGRGGMGEVYLAHSDTAGGDAPQQAAIKVLAAELSVDPGFQMRFQREIDILRQLDHPNIVRFRDSGQQNGRPYFVMEYVPGPSFDLILQQRGRLPWPEVLDLAWQIAPALKHAHDRGVIHRDLKPSNLLREPPPPPPTLLLNAEAGPYLSPALLGEKAREASVIKLTDFGIASLFASPHLTVTGGIVGTAEYLSPEQASGKPVTRRSDLYSLGVVLYTLVTGRTPFVGDPAELLQKHRFAQFERPTRLVPEIPHEFEDIIGELLEKDPAKRPADSMVLFKRLDGFKRKLAYQATNAGAETARHMARSQIQAPTRIEREKEEGPATLMSRLMRQELERLKKGGPLWQFMNRPSVLIALLLLTLGVIVWSLWPLSAETMYQRGVALMESPNEDDWETAWDKYFEPMLAKDPDSPHRTEVERFRPKCESARAVRKAKAAALFAGPMSEAQWFYQDGLRLRQQGDEAGAQRVWKALVRSFEEVPSEKPWVDLAKSELDKRGTITASERQWLSVRQALSRSRHLREEGKQKEADAILNALKELYRGNKQVEAILNGN